MSASVPSTDAILNQVIALLEAYGFELGDRKLQDWLADWYPLHSAQWIRLAVIEAIHRGRYKAISISQILANWQVKRTPNCRFNREFERLICGSGDLPFPEAVQTTTPEHSPPDSTPKLPPINPVPQSIQSSHHVLSVSSPELPIVTAPLPMPTDLLESNSPKTSTDEVSSYPVGSSLKETEKSKVKSPSEVNGNANGNGNEISDINGIEELCLVEDDSLIYQKLVGLSQQSPPAMPPPPAKSPHSPQIPSDE